MKKEIWKDCEWCECDGATHEVKNHKLADEYGDVKELDIINKLAGEKLK